MKTYVLIISKTFPKTHKKSGKETHFISLINAGVKKHTIRHNYPLWEKRVKEINAGRAVLSVRCWTGLPYRSPQVECLEFSRLGIQKIQFKIEELLIEPDKLVLYPIISLIDGKPNFVHISELAQNDGLSFEDLQDWFKPLPTEPMAILHFSDDFRYKTLPF